MNVKTSVALVALFTLSLVVGCSKAVPSAERVQNALGPETIAARQHFFGLDNVDPKTGAVPSDRVVLSWTGVASFAASFNGHVVLLDPWIARTGGIPSVTWPGIEYVGTTREELAALKPEVLFFGHAHYDHAGDMPFVVRANPGITVLGAAEECRDLAVEVTDVAHKCISVVPEGAPYGAMMELSDLLSGVEITGIKQPHSNFNGISDTNPRLPWPRGSAECFAYVHNLYPITNDPPAWGAPNSNGPPSGISADPPGGNPAFGAITMMWQIRVGDFAFTWQDTAGPIATGSPGLPAAFKKLKPTDVRAASIVVAGVNTITEHTELLRPKVFIPLHHDPCGNYLRPALLAHLATIPANIRPALLFIADPSDYLKPIVFDPSAKIWQD